MHPVIGADLSLDAEPLFQGTVPLMERVSFEARAEGTSDRDGRNQATGLTVSSVDPEREHELDR